jgi:DNA-binding transcriptional MerR regulator
VSRLYQVQEFAKLAGVTVRALHHYDRLALLRPRRTAAGYRLYGIRDLARLEQIVALKFLGLPLQQIKSLLDRDTRGWSDVLRSQRQALEEKRRHLDRAIRAIRDAERAVRPGRTDTAALKKIIEVIEMQDQTDFMKKYYTDDARAKIEARREQWTPELQEQTSKAWTELFRDVEAALEEDPAGEKAQALAARWRKLVEGFTGADREVNAGLRKAWADRENWPASLKQHSQPYVNPQVWEFMQKAMACRKA